MDNMKYFHTDDIWESLADKGRAEVDLHYVDEQRFCKELHAEAAEEGVRLRIISIGSARSIDNITLRIYLVKMLSIPGVCQDD